MGNLERWSARHAARINELERRIRAVRRQVKLAHDGRRCPDGGWGCRRCAPWYREYERVKAATPWWLRVLIGLAPGPTWRPA